MVETQYYCPIVRWTLGSLIHVKEPFFEQMRNWQAQLWCKLHASAWAAWFPLSTRFFDVRKLPKDGLFFSCSALATCTKSIHFAVASEDVCLKTIGCLRGEWPPEGCKGVPLHNLMTNKVAMLAALRWWRRSLLRRLSTGKALVNLGGDVWHCSSHSWRSFTSHRIPFWNLHSGNLA